MAIRDEYNNLVGTKFAGETVYEYDWFSGSQINIMLGDVVIDSAVGISFNVQQTKTPVYGYASQYYKFVANGHVLVQGNLTIAFKETGYLMYPIQRLLQNQAITRNLGYSDEARNKYSTSPKYSMKNGEMQRTYNADSQSLTESANAGHRKRVMQANVEQMFEWQERGGDPRLQRRYNKFWRQLGRLPDDKFEEWADTFEDAIWYGSDNSNPVVRDKFFTNNIPDGASVADEDILRHRRLDQYPEMDIIISYGDQSVHSANHTVKKILDVNFTGQSQTIEISGQPVYEQYSFIARNLA